MSDLGKRPVRRRDFLAGSISALTLAGFPLVSKPALGQTTAVGAPPGATISKVRVYPAIGICRVGGSAEWFYAPEVPGLAPQPQGGFKDGDQLIKKQVQRFRVYAFDAEDRVIGEVTAANARIDWRVHLANTKAAWYEFNNPLDNGEDAPGLPGRMRNQFFVHDDEREDNLIINGGLKAITGSDTNASGGDVEYAFEGEFWGQARVGLGELRTDNAGRLMVVPPDGVSSSPIGAPIASFADNDGWHDDWCDGPVTAEVTLSDGRTLQAEPSWVACCGPDFAPEIQSITTLYDLISDLNVSMGWTEPPARPLSFQRDIYPTLRRVALMAWVTNAARHRSAWLSVDFSDPALMEKLADPSAENAALRQEVFGLFRDPSQRGPDAFKDQRLKIPYHLGEGINYDGSPLQWFQFPALQYDMLRAWADGDFENDTDDTSHGAAAALEDLPIAAQPAALTQAALEACTGGAFHPGVELTYYLRIKQMYARNLDESAEPFRIAHGPRDSLLQTVGRLLSTETAFEGGNGNPPPFGPQAPGDLTRWMGLPWQCDAFSCQQVLMQDDFPTAVWWPAQLPIDVLPEAHYEQIMRSDLSERERMKFYDSRVAWSRGVAGIGYHASASYWDGITNMISLWERMGFVVRRPGPTDPGAPEAIPGEVYVETDRSDMEFRFDWSPADGVRPN